ncbi:MAG: hypothetical protein AB1782_04275 [Cyanobacteriota bacterium]
MIKFYRIFLIIIFSSILQSCCCCGSGSGVNYNVNASNSFAQVSEALSNNSSEKQENYSFVFSRDKDIYLFKNSPEKIITGYNPALNPEHNKLAFSKILEYGNAGILIYNIDSSETKTLLPDTNLVSNLMWSPDGKYISYLGRDNNFTLLIIDTETEETKTLIQPGKTTPFQPTWTGDSKAILFQDMESLHKTDLNGNVISSIKLKDITGQDYSATSEDRFIECPIDPNLIAFTKQVEGTPEFTEAFNELNTALYIYNKETKESNRLTPEDMLAIYPIWTLDGKYIYFTGYKNEHINDLNLFRIFRIKPDGSGLTEITSGSDASL